MHNLGFGGPYPGGRHVYMVKGDMKIRIPNPHQGDISKPLVAKIIKEISISNKEWDNV